MNFESGHYRSSNNRAYYAVFRAISACLALEFKAYKQHSQVIGNFNKDFVHAGIFPKEISRKISRTQEVRHSSDYDDFYVISIEDAREQLETAREVKTNFYSNIRKLRRKSFGGIAATLETIYLKCYLKCYNLETVKFTMYFVVSGVRERAVQ